MKSDTEFEEKLAIGTAGEDIVYEYLKRNNSLVQDMRYQKHDKGSGPRLEGTEGSVILPDFAVYNKSPSKGSYTVDVKVKSDLYTIDRKKCFTVDKKFLDYKKATQILKLDFLLLIFMYEDRMYFYKDSEVHGTREYNNQYGKGTVYGFAHDVSRIRY